MTTKIDFKQKMTSKLRAIEWNSRLGSHEYTERRLTFGKFTGCKISDLPMSYLKWAILNLDQGPVLDYLIRELQRRDKSFK